MNNDNINKQINYLKKQNQFLDEYLEFYQKILTIQNTQKIHINKDFLSILGKTQDIANHLSDGLPLLEKFLLLIRPIKKKNPEIKYISVIIIRKIIGIYFFVP